MGTQGRSYRSICGFPGAVSVTLCTRLHRFGTVVCTRDNWGCPGTLGRLQRRWNAPDRPSDSAKLTDQPATFLDNYVLGHRTLVMVIDRLAPARGTYQHGLVYYSL